MGGSCTRRCFRREYPNPKSSTSVLFRTVRGSCVVMIGGLFGRWYHELSHGLGEAGCVAVSIFVGIGNAYDLPAPSASVCGCIWAASPSDPAAERLEVNRLSGRGAVTNAQIELEPLLSRLRGLHMPRQGCGPLNLAPYFDLTAARSSCIGAPVIFIISMSRSVQHAFWTDQRD